MTAGTSSLSTGSASLTIKGCCSEEGVVDGDADLITRGWEQSY
jgi:hypothetical protein